MTALLPLFAAAPPADRSANLLSAARAFTPPEPITPPGPPTETWARERGAPKLMLMVSNDNAKVLSFTGAEPEARLAEREEPNVIALHPAAPQRYRELIGNLAPVLASGDTVELSAAREEFRKLIRSVVVTRREERGRFDVTVDTKTAALVSRGGRVEILGAGTGFEPVTFRL